MRIIPVLDLMQGQIVRGIAGQRESYRPIKSSLVAGSDHAAIAGALAQVFSANEMYLADLDAIRGGEPAWSTYAMLLNDGVSLWIDAGIENADRARQLVNFEPGVSAPGVELPSDRSSRTTRSPGANTPGSGSVGTRGRVSGIIAGLESLPNSAALAAILDAVGPERLIFSLDLQQGRPLASFDNWRHLAPLDIARAAIEIGVRRMIVLDLAGVGGGGGVPTLELCRAIRAEAPTLELTGGGGVRHVGDLSEMSRAGCSAALVASALHDGRITPADLASFAGAR